ncbi:MAG TPA: hypothetical protein VFE51_22400 [Verrucomicrobiae bacterium]|nr:hypothetical protein [Verrucomicrobiae bacterium]
MSRGINAVYDTNQAQFVVRRQLGELDRQLTMNIKEIAEPCRTQFQVSR